MKENEFFVYMGDVLIGLAKDVGSDMPNIIGAFHPMPAFEGVAALFDKEYSLIQGPTVEWHAVKDAIFALGLRLEHKGTGEVFRSVPGKIPGPTFRNEIAYLHIHESKIWWRLM